MTTPNPIDTARASQEPILVLGGGPIGMAFALLAAKAEFHVMVVDAKPVATLRQDRRLLALSQGSLLVLRTLLGSSLKPCADIRDIHVCSQGEPGHARLGQHDFPDHPLGATVWYADLVRALDEAIAQSPYIQVKRPCRANSPVHNGTDATVSVALEDGSVLRSALVVVAEGTPSQATATQCGLLADVLMPAFPEGLALERFTPDGPLALLPMPEHASSYPAGPPGSRWMSMVWCQAIALGEARRDADPAQLCQEIGAALGPRWGQPLQVGPRVIFPLLTHRLDQVCQGRIVRLGNAAQAMHPVAGQGFNLGLRDVATLVDCLVDARRLHQSTANSHLPPDPVLALATYEKRRRLDRRLVPEMTRWLPRLFSSSLLPVRAGRSLGLMALDLCPPLRRGFSRLLMLGPG